LHLVGINLELSVMMQIVDSAAACLDEDESTDFRAPRLEDRGIEPLDPSVGATSSSR